MSATAPAREQEQSRPLSEHTRRRLSAPAAPRELTGERLLAFEALRRWQQLTAALIEAYSEGQGDRLKRLRRLRRLAAAQTERRYQAITPAPRIPLGNLRRDPTAKKATAERAALAAAA